MENQTDIDIRDRIKNVFENFEDPFADEGWLLLLEKYPEKKRRIAAWFWWPMAAAILLLCIGIALFKNYEKNEPDKLGNKIIKQHQQQNIAANKQTLPGKPAMGTQTVIRDIDKPAKKQIMPDKLTVSEQAIASTINNNRHAKKQLIEKNKTTAKYAPVVKQSAKEKILIRNEPQIAMNKASAKIADSSLITRSNIALPKLVNIDAGTNSVAQSNSIMRKPTMIIHDPGSDTHAVAKNNSSAHDDKKIRFSIYAATYFNYAKGSNNPINAGAGGNADIKIGKNLTFSTGLALAQNTLNYTSIPTAASQQNFAALAPVVDIGGISGISVSGFNFKSFNANLIDLDIPLNLKYDLGSKNHNLYVLAGLSSGTFINETYTYNYLSGPQTNTASVNKSFGNFYFAKTLNVSFGFGYPLSKTNNLIIEPFLKYPLDGLGAQQIKFGAGGLNLKFNVTPSKR